ncbi:MAG: LacI family DNA-binding transcriptional regulator [Spirochaetia bacterium]
MSVTIKDIARQARVSYATVSRAFSNKGVNPKTRARILEIAKRLNYTPNGIARGLVTKRTNTIGLILPDITNPFYPEVARGVEDGAKEHGYSVFLCNTNWERERENQYIRLLMERRVDGLIISPGSNVVDPVQERLTSATRVVYACEVPRKTDRSYVAIDNVRGGFLATKHLIEAGYGKIGFIGGIIEAGSTDERLEGYKLAFERYGLPVDERFIRLEHFDQNSGARVIKEMIDSGDFPRAVFAENDLLALGVIQGVRSAGLSVPEDVAVIGFDDIPIASFQEVQLTTVLQPKYEIGKTAVKILLEEIDLSQDSLGDEPSTRVIADGDHRGGATRIIIEPSLIVRKTSIMSGKKRI